ncbi:MAG TPA: Stk1 family PASTA domain-containing Ser/Thr kinase [Conexibacter sp.]|jgi:beta-lactam-binding protein with PASTA domain|nr:Stk1 family PASTA domain-containing Ser/Thr kinase [Conexibacter sp.]
MSETSPEALIDGRYKVLTRLGSGGMADVFCAEDQQLGRKVALKLLHRRFAEDAEFVERFRREASAAAGLQHPNVVGVYDRGEWDGTYYIAMEYLPGRSLKDVVRQEAPLDPVRAIDITVQILKAARFAHRRGIVHRDLKPHNVMVDDEDRAKVTDFGIARAGASDMTETGSIMGTAQYLSPEQAQGHAVSQQSDLYAVGVILFELLTGHVPFDAESAVTIALKHVSEPPPTPSAFDPSVPPGLEAVVLWALEKDPAQRPADADAFIAALEAARDEVLASEAPGQRTAMFAPAAIPLDPYGEEALAAAALPGDVAAEPPPYYAEPAHGEDDGERRRPRWWTWVLAALALAAIVVGIVLLMRPGDVTVPGVVGQDVQSATAALRTAGLKASVDHVTSSRPVDTVLAQDPGGGQHAKDGATVTLTVSRGPGQVAVPSVDGLDEQKAVAQLTDAGLVADRLVRQADATVPAGRVIRTSPAAGQTVARGSSVTLVVSSGPKQVGVPDVVGLTKQEAQQILGNQGFQFTSSEAGSDTVGPGTVLSQDPIAGAKVEPGSSVAIVIARAIPMVDVPDLLGQSGTEAAATLTAAGLVPRTSMRDVTDRAQDGIVLDQRPAPGTQVKKGAPVRIIVGRLVQTPTTPTTPTTPGAGGGQ